MKHLLFFLTVFSAPAAFAQSSGGTTIVCTQPGAIAPAIAYDYSWENGELTATKLTIHFRDENDDFSWENWKFQPKQDPGGFAENINLEPTTSRMVQTFLTYEQPGRGIYLIVDRHDIREKRDPNQNEGNYQNTFDFPAVIERAEEAVITRTPVKCSASERMHGMG
jgi:hypothetical protein